MRPTSAPVVRRIFQVVVRTVPPSRGTSTISNCGRHQDILQKRAVILRGPRGGGGDRLYRSRRTRTSSLRPWRPSIRGPDRRPSLSQCRVALRPTARPTTVQFPAPDRAGRRVPTPLTPGSPLLRRRTRRDLVPFGTRPIFRVRRSASRQQPPDPSREMPQSRPTRAGAPPAFRRPGLRSCTALRAGRHELCLIDRFAAWKQISAQAS